MISISHILKYGYYIVAGTRTGRRPTLSFHSCSVVYPVPLVLFLLYRCVQSNKVGKMLFGNLRTRSRSSGRELKMSFAHALALFLPAERALLGFPEYNRLFDCHHPWLKD